jgi:putative acetyltransferase
MQDITAEGPDQPDVVALLAASARYMAELYPAESNHMLDVGALKRSDVTFVVARLNGRAVGCGAVVRTEEDWAEIKCIFVSPRARGRSIGRQLLQKLEDMAVKQSAALLRLETGVKQFEALALYRSAGFVEIGPFGSIGPTRAAYSWRRESVTRRNEVVHYQGLTQGGCRLLPCRRERPVCRIFRRGATRYSCSASADPRTAMRDAHRGVPCWTSLWPGQSGCSRASKVHRPGAQR